MNEHDVAIGQLTLADAPTLENVVQRVTLYGDPSARTVLVPHALTGSSRVREWWGELVGPGKVLDPARYQIAGINALGGCYGSTGPHAGTPFPRVSVADIVKAQALALEQLGITQLALVIGASLGGMQALQWALDYPERVEQAIMVGSHDHQSAMGIALNAVQRDAIALEPAKGIRLARKIAMLSYKSDDLFKERHDRRHDRKGRFRFDVEGYLEHQADLFEARMEPRSYVTLTDAMDSFDVRDRVMPADLSAGRAPELVFVGITGDWLFRPQDVRAAAHRFSLAGYASRYEQIDSTHGHDAFLAEPEKLSSIVHRALPPSQQAFEGY